jgi:acyl-CoA synthetase (AMP-forming)/AMP-acid ligase II
MTDRPLLGWVDDAPADRGIRFAGAGGSWDFWSYQRLAGLARQVAAGLADAGVVRGDAVSFVQRSGPGFVGTLFGTMLAGAVPSPVAPPMVFQDLPGYRRHLAGLLAATRPALVVTDADLTGEVAELAPGSRVVPAGEVLGDPERAPRPRADLALLQFTSGSSGRARGVKVPFGALEANVTAIRRWLGMDGRRATASWLPLHHDMGLIGCLITPVVDGSDVWLLSPEDFVQRPLRYLRCFAATPAGTGAQLTAMPSFGLQYVARRVRPDALAGLDFSGWRAVIVGAERVSADALDRFHALLGPFGLSRRALLPAYGLAEATLAVTGLPVAEEWSALAVEPETLALGSEVVITAPEEARGGAVVGLADGAVGTAGCPADSAGGARGDAVPPALVGCGRPLAGVSVTVAGEDGAALPDGRVGEILVRGPAVMAGYLAAEESRSLTSLAGGTLSTGDAGFVAGGQLYVLGRLGDSMKVRARAVFAEDLEAALAAAGMAGHRVAVALGDRAGTPTAVAVLERPAPEWADEARTLLRRGTEGAEVVVICARAGTIPRTSSGKPKRRELWRAFLDGRLDQSGTGPRIPGAANGNG